MTQAPAEVARNQWGVVLDHRQWATLELRWLPTTSEMGDDGFKETLELFAAEGERAKPSYMIIDAVELRSSPSSGLRGCRGRSSPEALPSPTARPPSRQDGSRAGSGPISG